MKPESIIPRKLIYVWLERFEKNHIIVKVGQSNDLEKRMKNSNTARPEPIRVIHAWEVDKIKSDKQIHDVLKERGLWVELGGGTEFFKIPVSATTDEGKLNEGFEYIDDVITELEGKKIRPEYNLRASQYNVLNQTLGIIKNNYKATVSIAAILAARFGKTLYGLALFDKLYEIHGINTMIFAGFYLHKSFLEELDKYRNFSDIVVINASDDDAEEKYNDAIKNNKRVFIDLSLHITLNEFTKKYDWINKIPSDKKYIFCDEGDYGTHRPLQRAKVSFITQENVKNPGAPQVIIGASGTNSHLTASITGKVDGVVYATYSELEKTEDVPRRHFFMLGLDSLIGYVKNVNDEHKPSWFKIWKQPYANREFLKQFIRSLVGLEPLRPGLNLSNIANEDINVFMIATSADIKSMNKAAEIFKKYAPEYHIVVLNSDHTSNRKATEKTKQEIVKAKLDGKSGVIILTNQMGSRSFSVPEIQAVILAYDNGSVAAATQLASRALTSGNKFDGEKKEKACIVSVSFDPNRSEHISGMIIDEAMQVRKSTGMSYTNAVRSVMASINCFEVGDYGNLVAVNEEDILLRMDKQENLLRVADSCANTQAANEIINDPELMSKLKNMFSGSMKNTKTKHDAITGTINTVPKNNNKNSITSDVEKKSRENIIRKVVQAINMSATSVQSLAGWSVNTYRGCLDIIKNDTSRNKEFNEIYGADPIVVEKLLDKGLLSENMLDLIVEQSKNSIRSPFEEMS